jgi:DNA-binding NtrC family response regulator
MLKVLVVDDQAAVRMALTTLFELHELETLTASTPDEALALISAEDVGVVIQDLNYRRDATSGDEGLHLLRQIKALDPELPVLVMTAWSSIAAAVQLIKEGASDYIAKPWDDERLVAGVRNLVQLRTLHQENTRIRAAGSRAREELARTSDLQGLQYASNEMHVAVSLAIRVARADVSVLVTGPNGVGKERIASILWANSRRKSGPFVKVDVGALPRELLEAELFGAEAGAFTGATKLRTGRFEDADGGTLFLDEIGNLPLEGQKKLLRVLQTGEYQRLGSSTTRKTDVRIVSATNADLASAVAEGHFREDLYFRLNVIEIAVPALGTRTADVEVLAATFLARHPTEDGRTLRLDAAAHQALADHDWPGNVRELENRVIRATLVARGDVITPGDLGLPVARAEAALRSSQAPANDDPERVEIEQAIEGARGVIAKAAARLGISRQALYRRMDRLGIQVERKVR